MSKPQKSGETKWKKVAPCLYRYNGRTYYALFKRSGKQIRISLETEDLATAKRKLIDKQNDLENSDPALARTKLADLAERFLEKATGADSTLDNLRRSIKKLVEDWPKGFPALVSKIKKSDCELWLAQYADLSPSTVNHMITDVTRFFDMAVGDGVMARNPMDGVKYRKIEKPTKLTPTLEQFTAIVTDLRGQQANGHGAEETADFVELAGTLGLGQAELSGIERQHIDLDSGVIQIFRRKTRQAFAIPIYPDARDIIERRLDAMPKTPTARLLAHNDCKKGLAAACRRLGFPNFEPRSLRRYFITRALRAGIDAPTVAAWQGHRDGGALVLKTYGDVVRMDHSLKMAQLLGAK